MARDIDKARWEARLEQEAYAKKRIRAVEAERDELREVVRIASITARTANALLTRVRAGAIDDAEIRRLARLYPATPAEPEVP